MGMARQAGRSDRPHIPRLSGKGKEMRARSSARPRRMRRAARSGGQRKGLGPGMAAHMGEDT